MLQSMRIVGGKPLFGEICISGAKNLALPAIAATILTDQQVILRNVPELSDTKFMREIMSILGCNINLINDHCYSFTCKDILTITTDYDIVRKMRASILLLGALLGRCHEVKISMPGGCAIGNRAINLHIYAMRQLGAEVTIESGYIHAKADKLIGSDIVFDNITVGGTENAILAAVTATGTTNIINPAHEPEVIELCKMLNAMGANIYINNKDNVITIDGVDKLHGTDFTIMDDRIEAGTYAIAAAITKGKIKLTNCTATNLTIFFDALQKANIKVDICDDCVVVDCTNTEIMPHNINTAPYPLFPTDLQAQYVALMTIANGCSCVTENIFENRFMHVPELNRMGANIIINNNTLTVNGVEKLQGASVMATDLRASVALVLAGLSAEGETIVNRLYHIDRGYENIDYKLRECGAQIERFDIN